MRAPSSILILFASIVAGCSGGCSGASEETPATASAQRTEASGGETPTVAAEPGPVPVLRIAGAVDRYDRSVALRVENRGTEQIELRSALALQQQDGEGWGEVSARLALRDSCSADAPECITLAPGAVYIPTAWKAKLGDAQCGDGEAAPAGTYRVVVTSCSGAHQVEGEPIALP